MSTAPNHDQPRRACAHVEPVGEPLDLAAAHDEVDQALKDMAARFPDRLEIRGGVLRVRRFQE